MRIRNDIRKRANRLFFIKVTINILLIIIGAVCITLFLRNMQHRTSLSRQWQNSQLALKQVTSSLNQNSQTAEDLSSLFHDGNQDMLDDLQTILSNGGFDQLDSSTESDALPFSVISRNELTRITFSCCCRTGVYMSRLPPRILKRHLPISGSCLRTPATDS